MQSWKIVGAVLVLSVMPLRAKAQASSIAVATTRNHGHFGAAGIYARIPLAHDLFSYVTSGHQLNLPPGDFVMGAAGRSLIVT